MRYLGAIRYGTVLRSLCRPCSPLVSLPIKVLFFSAAASAAPPFTHAIHLFCPFLSFSFSFPFHFFLPSSFLLEPLQVQNLFAPSATQLVITHCINHKQVDGRLFDDCAGLSLVSKINLPHKVLKFGFPPSGPRSYTNNVVAL